MPEPEIRFIDLATCPLSGNEQARDHARGELMDRLTHASPSPEDDSLETAIARLESKPPLPLRKAVGYSFLALALISALMVVIYAAAITEIVRLAPFHRIRFPGAAERYQKRMDRLGEKLSPDQRLFFFANTYGFGRTYVNRWLSDGMENPPEDPAWFEEFFTNARKYGHNFPDRYREHGKRIDPGNGIWALRDVETLGMVLSNDDKVPGPGRSYSSPEYLQAISLIEEGARAPRIESYIPERTKERLQMMGAPSDLADVGDRMNVAILQRSHISGRGLDEIFSARATELALSKDVEGLKKWIALGEKLTMEGLRNPDAVSMKWAPLFCQQGVVSTVRKGARGLGLVEEEARLSKWDLALRSLDVPLSFDLDLYASTSAVPKARPYGLDAREGLVTMEELEPGRHAEHALIDRYTAYIVAGVFTVLAFLAFIEAWRRPLPVRGLAQGLMPLLRRSDYLWLLGLGFALPVAWYVILMRLTPLGCRDFAIGLASHVPWYARVIGLILLSLCLLIQTASWRLAKRGGFVGLRSGLLWPGWAVAVFVAIYIPVTGLIRLKPDLREIYLLCGLSALGVPILWLLWKAGALVFRPRHAALGGVMLCRMLVVAFLISALALLATAPLLKMEERAWVARDTIGGPARDGSPDTVLAARSEALFRERLLKAME